MRNPQGEPRTAPPVSLGTPPAASALASAGGSPHVASRGRRRSAAGGCRAPVPRRVDSELTASARPRA